MSIIKDDKIMGEHKCIQSPNVIFDDISIGHFSSNKPMLKKGSKSDFEKHLKRVDKLLKIVNEDKESLFVERKQHPNRYTPKQFFKRVKGSTYLISNLNGIREGVVCLMSMNLRDQPIRVNVLELLDRIEFEIMSHRK